MIYFRGLQNKNMQEQCIAQTYSPDVDLKKLCMDKLKGDDEVLINNRHRTFPTTYGSLAIIDLYFVISS